MVRRAATRTTGQRRSTFSLLAGLLVGILLVGLGLPAVVDDDSDSGQNAGALGPAGAGRADGEPLAPTETPSQPGEVGEGGGTATGSGGTSPSGAREGGAAGGGPSAPPPRATRGTSAAADQPRLTATERGVTADRIKVGFMLLDVGSIGPFGIPVPGVDPEQQEAAFRAYIDEVNEAGGIHGRLIEPVFRAFDVLSPEQQRAVCLSLTQDAQVFAVIAQGGTDPRTGLCVTKENQTLMLNHGGLGMPTEFIERADGLMFLLYQHGNRMMFNFAAEMDRLGALDGATIGILSNARTDPSGKTVDDGLVPGLKRFGHDVAYIARLSADVHTSSSQIPIEVQQMRSRGVDTVLLISATLNSTQFVQEADSQRYFPTYWVSDYSSMSADASAQNMPDSFEGTLAFAAQRANEELAGIPEKPNATRCREVYERRTGDTLEDRDEADYSLTMTACLYIDMFTAGAKAAGPTLTIRAAIRGMHSVGELPGAILHGGLAPGKWDYADFVRTSEWRTDCECWFPISDFRRTTF